MGQDPTVDQRHCHIVVVDDAALHVTATQTPCGWVLPFVPQIDSTHIEDAYHAALTELLGDETADHRLIHCARFEYPPGSSQIHAYCLVERRTSLPRASHPRRWWTVDDLLSRPSAFAEQTAAFRLAMQRLRHPVGAFDASSAISDMESWVRGVLTGIDPADEFQDIFWRRMARNDAVGTCYTARGNRMFVKGGAHRASQEALLADTLNTCVAGCAPQTLALDRERGWWLAADAGGYHLPPSHRTVAWYLKAIDTCAELQHALPRDCEVSKLLGQRTADAPSLTELVPLIVEWGASARTSASASASGLVGPGAVEEALMETLDRLAAVEPSGYWVHFDLTFDNIRILRDGALCFVDLEYGCLGTPLLSYGFLVREAARRSRAAASACEDRIVSHWAGRSRERWYASLRDLPVLTLMLKLYVMRQRQADYAAETVAVADVLFANLFVSLARQIVELLQPHQVRVEV
jgi:hypothetical protein